MARVLGYGGIAATNGARDFTGKEEAPIVIVNLYSGLTYAAIHRSIRHLWIIAFVLREFLRRLLA